MGAGIGHQFLRPRAPGCVFVCACKNYLAVGQKGEDRKLTLPAGRSTLLHKFCLSRFDGFGGGQFHTAHTSIRDSADKKCINIALPPQTHFYCEIKFGPHQSGGLCTTFCLTDSYIRYFYVISFYTCMRWVYYLVEMYLFAMAQGEWLFYLCFMVQRRVL